MIYVNGVPVTVVKFNGGEVQVSIDLPILNSLFKKEVDVKAIIKNSDDIMALIQTKTIIDKYNPTEVTLYLPRVPYAQSDRAMSRNECSGLKSFTAILNSLNFTHVCVDDPHSDVTEALINNILIRSQRQCISYLKKDFQTKYDYLVSPDGGALKKIYKSSKYLQIPVIEASKNRDVTTGQITNTSVNANGANLKGKSVLIIDDIIDGGRTFIELAKVLKEEHQVNQVDLYVTHGLFSKGFDLPFIDNYFVFHLWTKDQPTPSNIKFKNNF